MTTATATPSTEISATVFAAVFGKTLQAILFAWRKFHHTPLSPNLPSRILNDIGVNHPSRIALKFA